MKYNEVKRNDPCGEIGSRQRAKKRKDKNTANELVEITAFLSVSFGF